MNVGVGEIFLKFLFHSCVFFCNTNMCSTNITRALSDKSNFTLTFVQSYVPSFKETMNDIA